MKIINLLGREILDSRGNPTLEAELTLDTGHVGRASIPSGASTGSLEACELRDGDPKRYLGKGVLKAVAHINHEIKQALKGQAIPSQKELDTLLISLDATQNKSHLGANALLAVSLAFARAQAAAQEKSLYSFLNDGEEMVMPIPLMNVLNGGAHANNSLDIQEFMIVPHGLPDFRSALQSGVEIFQHLKQWLNTKGYSTAVGDEGGFAPNLSSNSQALEILSEAVLKAGYRLGKEISFALDVAASELFWEGCYHLSSEQAILQSDDLIAYYKDLITEYPIISIEDGLDEKDWEGWKRLTEALGKQVQLVGDDLFVTHPQRLNQGISQQVANAILIKPNQIGTLSETRQAIQIAKQANYGVVISHRSGETEDTFIADLSVATGAGQIKTGSLCRTDRIAKYNQLLRIQEKANLPLAKPLYVQTV